MDEIDISEFLPKFRETFIIAQQGKEAFCDEEKQVSTDLGISFVTFETGNGVYQNKDDAIAVAKKLIDNNPSRKLAVIACQEIEQ